MSNRENNSFIPKIGIAVQPMKFKFNCPSCGNKLFIGNVECKECNFTFKEWATYNKKQEEKHKKFLESIV